MPTKYFSKLLRESIVREVRYADADHASVHAFSGNWYQVDLVQWICACGRFKYNDIPCGHATVVIQRYRPPPPTSQRSRPRGTYQASPAVYSDATGAERRATMF